MRLSNTFVKSLKQVWYEEISINAQLLIRWWFVDKVMAWVYTYLPMWNIVLKKIENIVREEMFSIGANEIYMPALAPKQTWDKTWRWDEIDVLFKLEWATWHDYALNSTHEEIVTPLLAKYISSHKDLPKSVFQIQNKFRNEKRAKSWLLRWREFMMKDLYSFHENESDLDTYFDKVISAYRNVYNRLWLWDLTYEVEAPGWDFSDKPSIEFQTLTQAWEDNIWIDEESNYAINEELAEKMSDKFELEKKWDEVLSIFSKTLWRKLTKQKAAEVWNIFKLYDRFSKSFDLTYTNKDNKKEYVQMWCYWIWISRLMAVLVEVFNDEKWIVWPETVAPYKYVIIPIWEKWIKKAEEIYDAMYKSWKEVLIDDREQSPWFKLKDADLIWYPYQIVVSDKTLENWDNVVELIKRKTWEKLLLDWSDI